MLSVCLIASGLFFFTYHVDMFDTFGFTLVLLAAFAGGIRWSFSQMLMQKRGMSNPVDMMCKNIVDPPNIAMVPIQVFRKHTQS